MKEKFHFIGIKGSGMSSLAQIIFDNGYEVQGSDLESDFFTQKGLEDRGIIMLPFSKKNITGEHTYILGNAFTEKNEEIKEVLDKGYRSFSYYKFLGNFMKKFISVGISGTHGKTSTTSLLSHILSHLYPTSALIGDGTGYGSPNNKYFVFEACEYKRHFLAYRPDYSIITNIDFDHPDYFEDIDDVINAFDNFALNTKKKVVVCGDDLNTTKLKDFKRMVTYGLKETNDVHAKNIKVKSTGTSFEIVFYQKSLGTVNVPLYGTHSVQNTLAAITVCLLEKMDLSKIKSYIQTFAGAKRRFSIEEWNNVTIVDDYAHHPREIEATIEAARQRFQDKEIVAIFQPHTFTRTAKFLDEFKDSLCKADKVFGCPIFGSVREQSESITIQDLLNKIPGSEILTLNAIDKLFKHNDSVLLFMGAGDIGKYIDSYKKATS